MTVPKFGEWQPIETAPFWKAVIIFDPEAPRRKSAHKVNVATKLKENHWGQSTHGYKPRNPTHWMPLPDEPEVGK